MRSLLKERIRAAVDLVGDALRREISDRRGFIESLRREYESKALKPLWCFSDDPYDEELAFIYAVGKQVAAEEVSELREVFALEVGADAVISAILSGGMRGMLWGSVWVQAVLAKFSLYPGWQHPTI
ncbi:MAG: DUF2192 domain-containing protein [Thermofilaceae archaeon]